MAGTAGRWEGGEEVKGALNLGGAQRLDGNTNQRTTLYAEGRAGEAVPLLRRALTLAEDSLEPDHPNLAALRGNLQKVEAG